MHYNIAYFMCQVKTLRYLNKLHHLEESYNKNGITKLQNNHLKNLSKYKFLLNRSVIINYERNDICSVVLIKPLIAVK